MKQEHENKAFDPRDEVQSNSDLAAKQEAAKETQAAARVAEQAAIDEAAEQAAYNDPKNNDKA